MSTGPLRGPVRRPPIDPAAWDGQLVRELLAVVYGCHRGRGGLWVPDWAAVARRRRISVRTARRWATPGGPASIPDRQLVAIVSARRPAAGQLRAEHLQANRTEQIAARARLGRGRGRLAADYARLGWLEPHRLLVVEDDHQPLRRALVVRDDPALIRRATRGARVVDLTLTDTRWTATRLHHQLLAATTPWRITAPINTHRPRATGHTGTWLASAPTPELPLTATLNP